MDMETLWIQLNQALQLGDIEWARSIYKAMEEMREEEQSGAA